MLKGIALATVLAAGLTVAACGGAERLSKPEYGARLHTINIRVGQAEGRAEAAFATGRSLNRGRRAILAWADVEEQAGRELARLRPPEDAQDANDNLSAAEKDFATALRNAATALKGGQLAEGPKILERQMQTSHAPAELDHAIAQLKALGYTNS